MAEWKNTWMNELAKGFLPRLNKESINKRLIAYRRDIKAFIKKEKSLEYQCCSTMDSSFHSNVQIANCKTLCWHLYSSIFLQATIDCLSVPRCRGNVLNAFRYFVLTTATILMAIPNTCSDLQLSKLQDYVKGKLTAWEPVWKIPNKQASNL